MTRFAKLTTAFAIGGTLLLAPIVASVPADAAMTKQQRAALKTKKAECNAQATAQKLRLVKRWRFVRKCMKAA